MSTTMNVRDNNQKSAIDRQMLGRAEIADLRPELAEVRRAEDSDSRMSQR